MCKWRRGVGALVAAACVCLSVSSAAAETSGEGEPRKDRAYYESRGLAVWEVPTEHRVIALTFDDGPDPQETPEILDILRQYHAKATFFVVGREAEQHPEIVLREFMEGHEVANHTYSHRYFDGATTDADIVRELSDADAALTKITGVKPKLFRPPGGVYNESVVGMSLSKGYSVVLWSWRHDTKDWRRPGVKRIADHVINHARGGDIVLMHDHVQGRSQTPDALRLILPELQKKGFRFVTVTELLGIAGKGVLSEPGTK